MKFYSRRNFRNFINFKQAYFPKRSQKYGSLAIQENEKTRRNHGSLAKRTSIEVFEVVEVFPRKNFIRRGGLILSYFEPHKHTNRLFNSLLGRLVTVSFKKEEYKQIYYYTGRLIGVNEFFLVLKNRAGKLRFLSIRDVLDVVELGEA